MKKIFLAGTLLFVSMATAFAQSGTNSPYSQYGLGILSEQATGFNSGMNGVGLGFHEHNQVNVLNPASYSALDSLTFIFDVGASAQLTNFTESGTKINAKNADFEYAVAGFRAFRHLGVSFGLIPFTNIGYNFSVDGYVGGSTTATHTTAYSGSGGLHQFFLGAGWELYKGLSIGANLSYLWGDYTKSVSTSFSDSYAYTLSRKYVADVRSYKLDLGVQYTFPVRKNDWLTVGMTFSPGHNIGGNPQTISTATNSTTTVSDTLPNTKKGQAELKLKIPSILGVGIMWNHENKIKLGLDYKFQKWSGLEALYLQASGDSSIYVLRGNQYKNRHQLTFGGVYVPDENSRTFLKRVQYRVGASYTSNYYKVNGVDGPSEYSVTAGFGIPIINTYSNRSMLNISGQWVHTSGCLIKENTFRINIGFTFNEKWFMKWKVE